MPSNLMGPGTRSERSAADVKAGQTQARREDANASAHPNKVTLAEVQNRKR